MKQIKAVLPVLLLTVLLLPQRGVLAAGIDGEAQEEKQTQESEDTGQVDMEYEGELDPTTLAPAEANGSGSEEVATRIAVTDSMYYDRSSDRFIYPVGDSGEEIKSNVADGSSHSPTGPSIS